MTNNGTIIKDINEIRSSISSYHAPEEGLISYKCQI